MCGPSAPDLIVRGFTYLRYLADYKIACFLILFKRNKNPEALDSARGTDRLVISLSTSRLVMRGRKGKHTSSSHRVRLPSRPTIR